MKQKSTLRYWLFNWYVVLAVGIAGTILFAIDNNITYIASLICLGYVAIVVIVLTIIGFYNAIKKKKPSTTNPNNPYAPK